MQIINFGNKNCFQMNVFLENFFYFFAFFIAFV